MLYYMTFLRFLKALYFYFMYVTIIISKRSVDKGIIGEDVRTFE